MGRSRDTGQFAGTRLPRDGDDSGPARAPPPQPRPARPHAARTIRLAGGDRLLRTLPGEPDGELRHRRDPVRRRRLGSPMIDFTLDPEVVELRDRVATFIRDVAIP